MLINAGTVSITSGTKILNFTGSDLFDRGAKAGDRFQLIGVEAFYHLEVDPTNNNSATIIETYGGQTVTDVAYQISNAYLDYGLHRVDPNEKDTFYSFNRNFEIIADELASVGATAEKTVIVPRLWVGEVVVNAEFGYLSFSNDSLIQKLAISTSSPVLETVVLDMAINGSWQSLDIELVAGSQSAMSETLDLDILASDEITFRCTAGSAVNIFVDVYWYATTTPAIRHDFYGMWIGDLVVSGRIRKGFLFPVSSKVIGLSYTIQAPAIGQDIILELYKDNVTTGVLATIAAGSETGYLSLTQTEFDTDETCDININQIGTVPGKNLEITLHSYKVV